MEMEMATGMEIESLIVMVQGQTYTLHICRR
jgi:hypothetical protein